MFYQFRDSGLPPFLIEEPEKIGKEHLTYAQGASAELVAMATILAADRMGLPVSTTHVIFAFVLNLLLRFGVK